MNDCHICGWSAPTAANLRDHVLTAHPGQENVPVTRGYSMGILDEEKPSIDWGAIADRIRTTHNDLIDSAIMASHVKWMESAAARADQIAYEVLKNSLPGPIYVPTDQAKKIRFLRWVDGKTVFEDIPNDQD